MEKILIATLITMVTFSINAAETVDTNKILEYSDRTRGGIKEGLEWKVNLNSLDEGDKTEREFFVKNKVNDSYVESLTPKKNKGEVFVFNSRTIWFFKPGLRKPVAISARQKLSGVASNGDIASTNYVRDYAATFSKIEPINGEDCYLLNLKSKATDTTYDRINYWVSKKTGLALKADFQSLSGKTLKTAVFSYGNKVTYKGETFPFISEMKITDAKNIKNQSTLTYAIPTVKNHPDSLFNVNNLLR